MSSRLWWVIAAPLTSPHQRQQRQAGAVDITAATTPVDRTGWIVIRQPPTQSPHSHTPHSHHHCRIQPPFLLENKSRKAYKTYIYWCRRKYAYCNAENFILNQLFPLRFQTPIRFWSSAKIEIWNLKKRKHTSFWTRLWLVTSSYRRLVM